MAFYQFPGTDFHDLNLDWLLQQMKACLAEWATTKTAWESLAASNAEFKETIEAEWDELETFVNNYFANLDLSDEVSAKINEMVADGSMLLLIQATVQTSSATAAAAWLAEHVVQETGYVIDDTLTVANAAADSKAVGDRFGEVGETVQTEWNNIFSDMNRPMTFVLGTFDTTTGSLTTSTTRARATYFYERSPAYVTCDSDVEYRLVWYDATAANPTGPSGFIGFTPAGFTQDPQEIPAGSLVGILARFKANPSDTIQDPTVFTNKIHLLFPFSSRGVLAGKKLSVLGDSISAFTGHTAGYTPYYTGENAGVPFYQQMWWNVLCEASGMTPLVINAESGSAITTLTDSAHAEKTPISSEQRTAELNDGTTTPDVIIIAGGLNDFSYAQQASQEPGSWDGKTAPVADSSFSETYAIMIKRLQTNYPNAIIIALSTMYTMRGTSNGYTFTHTSTGTGNVYTQSDYNNAIKRVCEIMGVLYIDVYSMGLNRGNMYGKFANDDQSHPTHYNRFGQAMLARCIYKQIIKATPYLEGVQSRLSQNDI